MNETGIGARIINYVVDTLLVFVLSYLLYKWYTFYVLFWEYRFFPYYLFFYGTQFLYYFILELLLKRTPGKYLSLSKVINERGGRPNIGQIFIRSFVRITLISPFFIPILGRPLHDWLSKTRVVEI